MSFDFGDNKASDPTADFTSKFPSLDGDDGDAALTGATGGASSGGVPPALDDFENDLLGGGGGGGGGDAGGATSTSYPSLDSPEEPSSPAQPKDEREQFASQFPELDDPDIGGGNVAAVEPQQTVSAQSGESVRCIALLMSFAARTQSYNGGSSSGFLAATNNNTQISGRGPSPQPFAQGATVSSYDDEEEPEAIREWRHRQGDEIARRDAEAERKKAEAVSQAERDIDNFYSEYNAKKEKTIKKNKEDEAAFLEKRQKELAEGTTWDRITKLIDLQNSQSKTIAPGGAGSTDLSRFRGKRDGEGGFSAHGSWFTVH